MKPSLVTAIVAAVLPAAVYGHGYMTIPTGRTTDTINDMDNTGVCDSSYPGTVTEFEAGESIQVQWSRNNHIGGFIRFAMVPSGEESKENFDAGTFTYVCREVDCDLKQCDDVYCGDDSGTADNEIKCGTNIKLPDYLDAGDYVLQWTWFAAGSSYGNIGWTTGNYRTCADIKLTTSGSGSKPSCPSFTGGDRVTEMEGKSSDQCYYFDTNDLVTEEVKYDDETGYTRYMYGIPAEIEQCGGSVSSNSTSSAGSTTTSGQSSGPSSGQSSGEASTGGEGNSWGSETSTEGEGSSWGSESSSSGQDWSEDNGDEGVEDSQASASTANEEDGAPSESGDSTGEEATEAPAANHGCKAKTRA